MSDFFTVQKKDQGRIDHFCTLIFLNQQSHFLAGWRRNHIPRWSCDKRFPTAPTFLPTCQEHHPPSLMDKMVLLWECCSYRIVWTGLNWNGSGCAFYGRLCWEGKFAPVWNWHYIYREQGGNKYKGQRVGDDYCQNYLPKTSAKLWSSQEGCGNEPQLSLPAKWLPWAVNLGGTIYLHYLYTQVVWSLQVRWLGEHIPWCVFCAWSIITVMHCHFLSVGGWGA